MPSPVLHLPFTFTYCKSGLTHRAKLLGRVHGVVVQATREILSSSSNGKVTITEGSWTSFNIKIWERWSQTEKKISYFALTEIIKK